MPKFVCQNEKCSSHGVIQSSTNVNYKWNSQLMRLEATESFCSVCGTFRDPVKEYSGWNDSWFKAESNRNYNNKSIKKYDYDHKYDSNEKVNLSKNK